MREPLESYLESLVPLSKRNAMDNVLAMRTRFLTLVFEDIFQRHNASAALRTAECMGIQDVYFIENENPFHAHPYVSRGANKWLNIHTINSQLEHASLVAVKEIKERGYAIVATGPAAKQYSPDDLPITKPIALFFGNEHKGLSHHIQDHADYFLSVPIVGFTESYNVSVSSALIIQSLLKRIRQSDSQWHLGEEEKSELKRNWVRQCVRHLEQITHQYELNSNG
jgi:tRNA (guanosine-2'-O-)-methyltransferase